MSRPSLTPVGSTYGNWKILEKSDYKTSGKNQTVILECLMCGSKRSTWLSNLRQNAVKCYDCHSKAKLFAKSLFEQKAFLVCYPDRVDIIHSEEALPAGVTAFRVVSDDMALPMVVAPTAKPDPDYGYEAFLAVPYDYIDFYCDEVNLDTEEMKKAMNLYDTLVERPNNRLSQHFKGSRSSWVENGVKMGYIYWKDSITWPKKPAEATPVPETLETLPNVDPDPLVTFPDDPQP